MADVAREQRRELRAVRIARAVERERRHRVVGLAPEEVLLGEDPHDVARGRYLRFGELVDHVVAPDRLRQHPETLAESIQAVADPPFRVEREQGVERGPVERGRVVLLDRVPVALLPVPEQVAEEAAGPRRAAFEEREAELWEPHRHTAEEQRPRGELAGRREVPDVVERVVRR